MQNVTAIIEGLLNGSIIPQGDEQQAILEKLDTQFETYKQHMDAAADAAEWADYYGADDVEEALIEDIKEAF